MELGGSLEGRCRWRGGGRGGPAAGGPMRVRPGLGGSGCRWRAGRWRWWGFGAEGRTGRWRRCRWPAAGHQMHPSRLLVDQHAARRGALADQLAADPLEDFRSSRHRPGMPGQPFRLGAHSHRRHSRAAADLVIALDRTLRLAVAHGAFPTSIFDDDAPGSAHGDGDGRGDRSAWAGVRRTGQVREAGCWQSLSRIVPLLGCVVRRGFKAMPNRLGAYRLAGHTAELDRGLARSCTAARALLHVHGRIAEETDPAAPLAAGMR